jgi:hypothetical protein
MGKECDEHVATIALKIAIPVQCPEADLLHHSDFGINIRIKNINRL